MAASRPAAAARRPGRSTTRMSARASATKSAGASAAGGRRAGAAGAAAGPAAAGPAGGQAGRGPGGRAADSGEGGVHGAHVPCRGASRLHPPKLHLASGVGLVAANMIGAGVFLSAGFMAQDMGPGPHPAGLGRRRRSSPSAAPSPTARWRGWCRAPAASTATSPSCCTRRSATWPAGPRCWSASRRRSRWTRWPPAPSPAPCFPSLSADAGPAPASWCCSPPSTPSASAPASALQNLLVVVKVLAAGRLRGGRPGPRDARLAGRLDAAQRPAPASRIGAVRLQPLLHRLRLLRLERRRLRRRGVRGPGPHRAARHAHRHRCWWPASTCVVNWIFVANLDPGTPPWSSSTTPSPGAARRTAR